MGVGKTPPPGRSGQAIAAKYYKRQCLAGKACPAFGKAVSFPRVNFEFPQLNAGFRATIGKHPRYLAVLNGGDVHEKGIGDFGDGCHGGRHHPDRGGASAGARNRTGSRLRSRRRCAGGWSGGEPMGLMAMGMARATVTIVPATMLRPTDPTLTIPVIIPTIGTTTTGAAGNSKSPEHGSGLFSCAAQRCECTAWSRVRTSRICRRFRCGHFPAWLQNIPRAHV